MAPIEASLTLNGYRTPSSADNFERAHAARLIDQLLSKGSVRA